MEGEIGQRERQRHVEAGEMRNRETESEEIKK